MAKQWINAALDGGPGFADKSYFFHDNQYVRYDWQPGQDRAEFGTVLTAPAWNMPPLFADNPDGMLDGQGPYQGKVYFFKGNQYSRYDWAGNCQDAGYPQALSAWGLQGAFASIDACMNGQLGYAPYAYFLKGSQYMRYEWATDRLSEGYPRPLTAWGLKGAFASGIDACVAGKGDYAGKSYLFKGDQYVRFDWKTGQVDADPQPILGNWPGLLELVAAGRAKTTAAQWLAQAQQQVVAYTAALNGGPAFGFNQTVFEQALATHFHLAPTLPTPQRLQYLTAINQTMSAIWPKWDASQTLFKARTDAEATADGGTKNGKPVRAYFTGVFIGFSENFVRDTGPYCQAAVLVHETVHAVDAVSGEPNNHIPEWFELPRPKTGDAPPKYYAEQTQDEALHNPSSYAAFAQHIFYGEDRRYGAGRPTD
ncbi:hypothetical protein GO988_02010 [Hymenobacter sp. HMF4947]|uniref:Lysine-specific metallo-endopeptidase domain-containing protein n=1 Tax=Hymenobacter ginkgonis TaxID=2682976 RepID=A0A7K1T9L9_9BACT|nr:hemopexin repeat-containing protein [Hymenobacter ginkgonis]MVN75093.1 hypothetical protein [Hymenobacter ginkgonis]